jgi:hypothetical protein
LFTKLARPFALVAMAALTAVGVAACGESSEEKATAQVCSSTKAIQAQISKLSSLTISSKAPEEIKEAAGAMEKEATKIKESTGNLPAASKAPVESAQNTLKAELAGLAAGVVSAAKSSQGAETALKQAEPEIKAAVGNLASSYKTAYESLKCS